MRQMAIDEVVWRLHDALRKNRLDGWEAKFAASIVRQSRRPDWWPSEKQERLMRRMAEELSIGPLVEVEQ